MKVDGKRYKEYLIQSFGIPTTGYTAHRKLQMTVRVIQLEEPDTEDRPTG